MEGVQKYFINTKEKKLIIKEKARETRVARQQTKEGIVYNMWQWNIKKKGKKHGEQR